MCFIIILLLFYFIGCIIYCLLNKHRVGEVESNYEGDEITEPQDIAFEALMWPSYLILFIILSPHIILTKLIELLYNGKNDIVRNR
jgi:hypothetical protein